MLSHFLMKLALVAMLFVLGLLPAPAQLVTITVTGTISSITGQFDSTVQVGHPFTETFTLNSQTVDPSGTGFYTNTYDPSANASETFGDYAFKQSDNVFAEITSSPPGYESRYAFGAYDFSNSSVEARLYLYSDSPAVAPNNAFSSIQQWPLSYFDSAFALYTDNSNTNYQQVQANIDSFTITTTAVPEPSGYALGMLAVLAFFVRTRWAKVRE